VTKVFKLEPTATVLARGVFIQKLVSPPATRTRSKVNLNKISNKPPPAPKKPETQGPAPVPYGFGNIPILEQIPCEFSPELLEALEMWDSLPSITPKRKKKKKKKM